MVIGVGDEEGVIGVNGCQAIFAIPGIGPDAVGHHVSIEIVAGNNFFDRIYRIARIDAGILIQGVG